MVVSVPTECVRKCIHFCHFRCIRKVSQNFVKVNRLVKSHNKEVIAYNPLQRIVCNFEDSLNFLVTHQCLISI